MIHFVPQKELDTDKWDACVRADGGQVFYGLSWYLDILSVDWDALVLNDYEAVMPLVHNKKMGFSYLFRPYGVQQLGIFSKIGHNEKLTHSFIAAIPEEYAYTEIFLNYNNVISPGEAYQLEENTNLVLSLSSSYRDIYEGYSSQTKKNLNKAKKAKHKVFEFDSPDQLIALFKTHKGKEVTTMKESFYQTMRQLMYVLMHKHRGYLWTIYNETNTIIAGAFFVEIGGRIVLLFSATTPEAKQTHAMTYLLDELFIARAGEDVLFDFEGSNTKSLAKFYSGFGALHQNYYQLKINKLPAPIRWFKR